MNLIWLAFMWLIFTPLMGLSTFFPQSIAAKIAHGLTIAISVLVFFALFSSANAEQEKNKRLGAWALAALHMLFVVLGFVLPGMIKKDLLRERERTIAIIIDREHKRSTGSRGSHDEIKIEYTAKGKVYRTQIDYDCGARAKVVSIEYAVRWPVFTTGEECL
jgi:hypothetical protein